MKDISVGDVVKSTAGRDKDKFFLVVEISEKFAVIADGKTRKIQNAKRKNLKHLVKAAGASLNSEALKINSGEPFGNEKLHRAITRAIQNQ